MHSLKHPYPSIRKDQICSYGGNQGWSARKDLQTCGCGVIAMADLLLYLRRYHGFDGPTEAALDPIPLDDYDRLTDRLQRHFLPMLTPFGINGLTLAAGISLYFRRHQIPLTAAWGVSKRNYWTTMAQMLDLDLPVILSVGPNLPLFWKQERLPFYQKTPEGHYVAVKRTKAHYVTATGLDEHWIRVSSWGKTYYIHRREYEDYGREHSNVIVHNLIRLTPRQCASSPL